MKFLALLENLGGKPRRQYKGHVFGIADWSRSQIEDRAGADVAIMTADSKGDVTLQILVDDGMAILVGHTESDNIIRKAKILLIEKRFWECFNK